MKKIVCLFISICMLFGLTACADPVNVYDESKVQLFIGNYNAGFGYAYLEAIGDRFEEFYKDRDFGNGKVGVEVVIDNNAGMNAAQIKASQNAIYFTEGINYYNFIAQDVFADITEVVRQDLAEFGEPGETIESKMHDYGTNAVNFYKTEADKYYSIPASEGMYCIIYDMDLFRDRSLYFAKGGCPSEYERPDTCASEPLTGSFDGQYRYTNGLNGEKSAGADGKYGTVDDGLPATYDEFFVLLDRMKNQAGVRPFTWSGAVAGSYNARIASQFWADYEGVNNLLLNYNLSGEAKDLVTVTAGGEVVFDENPTRIYVNETGTNAYELARQAGRYYAVDFWRRIMNDNANYTSNSIDEYESQTQAQTTFLYSSYLENRQPNAFLCDGNWWQNEAADTFDSMTQSYGDRASRNNRNFGVLPIPKVNSSLIGSGTTFLTGLNSSVFINANATGIERELAEDFLMFSTTDESLVEYTEIVGCTRPFDYDIEGYGMDENDPAYASTDYAQLSTFTQQQYEYHKNGAFFYASCSNNYALNHWNFFNIYEYSMQTRMSDNSQPMTSPYTAYISGSLSNAAGSKNYFDGIYTYFKEYWETEIL